MMSDEVRLAVFYAAAGVETGWGHVVRCGALASALVDCGWRAVFLCRAGMEDLFRAHIPEAVEVLNETEVDPDALSALLRDRWPDGCDLLVVDDYAIDETFEPRFRPWAKRSLVLEDIPNRHLAGDLVLDPTPARTRGDYDGLLPVDCGFIGSSEHALLRLPFSRVKRMPADPPRVLLAFGATDPDNWTATAVAALEGYSLDIVLGGMAPHLDDIRRLAAAHRREARVYVDIDAEELAALMGDCTLAVGAGGSGAWKRCAVGLPCVVVEVADNQQSVVRSLIAAGAAISGEEDLRLTVETVLSDRAGLDAMSRAAHRLCDGLGATRVAHMLTGIETRNDDSVTLRPASPADSDLMFQWQVHPETRRFAKQSKVPMREEHDAWFSRRMANPESLLYMIVHAGKPSGVLRLDREKDAAWLVSIYIAPDSYGRGIADAALALAHAIWPYHEFRAEVLEGNAISHKLFVGAGYCRTNGLYLYRAGQSANA